MFPNGRNSPHHQAKILSGFDLSERCSVCSLILDNLDYFVVLLPPTVKPVTYGGFVVRDLKLGLQAVSKPHALLVLLGMAFYHHRSQKFKLHLSLSGGMAEMYFVGFGQHSLAAFHLRKTCFTYMAQKASECLRRSTCECRGVCVCVWTEMDRWLQVNELKCLLQAPCTVLPCKDLTGGQREQ